MLEDAFPSDLCVLERGWLSSNALLMRGDTPTLIDTGHVSHAAQLQELIHHHLGQQPLHQIINTHLHSDHCGANAMLQERYPEVKISIAPGQWPLVQEWTLMEELHGQIGQYCPPFTAHERLEPNTEICIHQRTWQVFAAPGHDHDAILLFAPHEGILVSGDAFWENGFGVVFAELEREDGFVQVRQTLERIESLKAQWVIPGHGRLFSNVNVCLDQAKRKLDYFEKNPKAHAKYAGQVLVKFKLMLVELMNRTDLLNWAQGCETLLKTHAHFYTEMGFSQWIEFLLHELELKKSIRLSVEKVFNL